MPAVVGSMIVVGALTSCALLVHNVTEANKNIYCPKDEDTIDHSTVTRWFKTFLSGFKNLGHLARSGGPKSIDSEVVLKAIKANSTSSIRRVSGELAYSPV